MNSATAIQHSCAISDVDFSNVGEFVLARIVTWSLLLIIRNVMVWHEFPNTCCDCRLSTRIQVLHIFWILTVIVAEEIWTFGLKITLQLSVVQLWWMKYVCMRTLLIVTGLLVLFIHISCNNKDLASSWWLHTRQESCWVTLLAFYHPECGIVSNALGQSCLWCPNFWKPWPRNFIFCMHLISSGQLYM